MNYRNWNRFICVLLVASWVASSSGHSSDLKAPFALDTAETLPHGVSNPRFINIFASITSKFNDSGSVEPLGQPLSKLVLGTDILKAQEDSIKRTTVSGLLQRNDLTEKDSLGVTTGEVNTFADVKVAALAVGITDRLTIAGVLPIIHIDVSASTGFVANPNGLKLIADVGRSQSPLTADENSTKLNNSVNEKLTTWGYQPIPTHQTISGVGDAQMIAKYRVHDDGVNMTSIKGTLIFPTGITPNPDKALDIPTGDGRFGVGLGGVYDRKLPADFRLNSFVNYTALLPHTPDKRVPTSVYETLSREPAEEVYERTRHQFTVGTGIEETFPKLGISVGGAYAFQYMTRADYKPGTTFTEDRYYLLGDAQPLQSLHSVVAQAGFSTIEWFKEKKFVYPFRVNFSYVHPLVGRNVASSDLVAAELLVFF